jgi:hypothetical protein
MSVIDLIFFGFILNRRTRLFLVIFGHLDQDDYFLRNLSVDLQVTTVNVDYRFVSKISSPFSIRFSVSQQPRTRAKVADSVE